MASLSVALVGAAHAGASQIQNRFPEAQIELAGADSVQRVLQHADVVICSALSAADLRDAARLKLIQSIGAGTDQIDLAAVPRGCTVCNVYEHEIAIGEWVLMVMLALTRRLLSYDKNLRHADWGDVLFGGEPDRDLRGRTIGVVGIGHIGAEAARLARAIGMEAIGVTRHPTEHRRESLGLRSLRPISGLVDMMRDADFAVIAVPLGPDTINLVSRDALTALGPTGYLLNVARGPIVNEEALYDALQSGTIAGAGIDTWYHYPASLGEPTRPSRFDFSALTNVVMTPHVAGFARSTFDRRWALILDQIQRLLDGEEFANVVLRGHPGTGKGTPAPPRQ